MAGRLRRQHGRSAPISNSKNPLARALGLALQRARREEPGRPSSEELASAIGLSASLYRLVESGGAILQPAYALRTTLAFPNAKLEFLPLVCLLGVIQILESRDHPDNRRLLAEQMRQAEPRLAFVLDSLGGLDSSAMSTPESLSRCMHAVLAFLQTPLSSPEPPVDVARAWGERLARSSYPLHLEILDQISAELGSFSPGMSVNQLGQWEKRHAHRIGTAFALMTSPDVQREATRSTTARMTAPLTRSFFASTDPGAPSARSSTHHTSAGHPLLLTGTSDTGGVSRGRDCSGRRMSRRATDRSNGRRCCVHGGLGLLRLRCLLCQVASVPSSNTAGAAAPEDMVSILASTFLMGSHDGDESSDDHPQHRVILRAFQIDRARHEPCRIAALDVHLSHEKLDFWAVECRPATRRHARPAAHSACCILQEHRPRQAARSSASIRCCD